MNPIPQDLQTLGQLPEQHHLGIELELFRQLYGHEPSQFRSFLSSKQLHIHAMGIPKEAVAYTCNVKPKVDIKVSKIFASHDF